MEKQMTFWEHLDELRQIIFKVLILWIITAIGYFILMPSIFDKIILAPCNNDFIFYTLLRNIGQGLGLNQDFFIEEFNIKLTNINLVSPFLIHISTSFWLSVVTTTPFLIYQIWLFLKPALYKQELKQVKTALLIGTVFFFVGVLIGYYMVFPLTLRFLSTYELSNKIQNVLTLDSYIDNFMMLILSMGLAFELPLVTWLLSLLNIINRSTLKKYRKHAFASIVVLAAIITPTGDPFTLSIIVIPLYTLYELSILLIKERPQEV